MHARSTHRSASPGSTLALVALELCASSCATASRVALTARPETVGARPAARPSTSPGSTIVARDAVPLGDPAAMGPLQWLCAYGDDAAPGSAAVLPPGIISHLVYQLRNSDGDALDVVLSGVFDGATTDGLTVVARGARCADPYRVARYMPTDPAQYTEGSAVEFWDTHSVTAEFAPVAVPATESRFEWQSGAILRWTARCDGVLRSVTLRPLGVEFSAVITEPCVDENRPASP